MSFIRTVRFLFVLASGVAGVAIYAHQAAEHATPGEMIFWCLVGLFAGGLVVFAESQLRTTQPKALIVGLVGLYLGLLTAFLLYQMFNITHEVVSYAARVVLFTLFGYLGVVVSLRHVDRVDLSHSKFFTPPATELRGAKILDSSVIIDGRIADVLETRFMEGPILLPQFVIEEIQGIADSSQSARRKRGRRGLDIIKRMQDLDLSLRVIPDDIPEIQEVDSKLVALARKLRAFIVTNDYNLNKVAQIHGVEVLNINDLATAMRPVVMPDEELRVLIAKEGKEPDQGVGYLEDGTMVVVENGVERLGHTVNVTVIRVLQTAAGRMIFGRIQESFREK